MTAVTQAIPHDGQARPAFQDLHVNEAAFHQSLAYRNIIELGLSPDETEAALTPYKILTPSTP